MFFHFSSVPHHVDLFASQHLYSKCDFIDSVTGIDEFYLEHCCLTKLNQKRDHLVDELRKEKECLHAEDEVEVFGEGRYNRIRKLVWDLLEKPQTSRTANVRQLLCTNTVLLLFGPFSY